MTNPVSPAAPFVRPAKHLPRRHHRAVPLLLCLYFSLCAGALQARAEGTAVPVFAGQNATVPPLPARNATAAASPASLDPAWAALIQRLTGDGFDRTVMEPIFARLGPESYSPAFMAAKVMELHGVPGIGVNRKKTPEPTLPEGYTPPVPDVTVGSCLAFSKQYASVLTAIEKKHGVQTPAILAVLLIETSLGQDLGKDNALRALAGMAATNSPQLLASMGNNRQKSRINSASLARTLQDKSEWAYTELKALLRITEQGNCDPAAVPSSIYGAIGLCQFMPSNVEKFAVDGDNNGRIELFRLVDAMYSVAAYLEANGWRAASTDEQRHQVMLTYNNDDAYASTVLATAKRLENALGGKGKISLASSAVVGGYSKNPSARLDPSLRRMRRVPASARVQLNDYQQLLQ